jgi:hypothetical protein
VRSIGSVSAWIYSKKPLGDYYDTDVKNIVHCVVVVVFICSISSLFFCHQHADRLLSLSLSLVSLSNVQYTHTQKLKPLSREPQLNEFDFFSADFREELSALSGDLLFQQTEYINDCIKFILSLYKPNPEMRKVRFH